MDVERISWRPGAEFWLFGFAIWRNSSFCLMLASYGPIAVLAWVPALLCTTACGFPFEDLFCAILPCIACEDAEVGSRALLAGVLPGVALGA